MLFLAVLGVWPGRAVALAAQTRQPVPGISAATAESAPPASLCLPLASVPAGTPLEVRSGIDPGLCGRVPLGESLTGAQEPGEASGGPGRAFLYSALLPGLGQHHLDQKRKYAYFAIEAAGWIGYVNRRSTGHGLQQDYRDLAWDVARTSGPPRVDGDFNYYETLTRFAASGAYDADPSTPGIQPETDPVTHNGDVWVLAQGIFFPPGPPPEEGSPEYARAIEYYVDEAYNDVFLWDWTGNEAAQDRYLSLIEESDQALSQATTALGLIIANHVVSAVDAFVSARLREANIASDVEMRAGLSPRGDAVTFAVRLYR